MSNLVIDAAYPPASLPPGASGVLGYIGGAATHVWTPAQWKPFASVRQFPCWVANLKTSPAGQADAACSAAMNLGWAAHMPAGETRVIVCDLETAVDDAWYDAWQERVASHGFVSVAYGSLSTVLGNAAADNIVADWDGVKAIPAGQTIHGVQYQANARYAGTEIDWDLFDSWLMNRGGVGPRHGA